MGTMRRRGAAGAARQRGAPVYCVGQKHAARRTLLHERCVRSQHYIEKNQLKMLHLRQKCQFLECIRRSKGEWSNTNWGQRGMPMPPVWVEMLFVHAVSTFQAPIFLALSHFVAFSGILGLKMSQSLFLGPSKADHLCHTPFGGACEHPAKLGGLKMILNF